MTSPTVDTHVVITYRPLNDFDTLESVTFTNPEHAYYWVMASLELGLFACVSNVRGPGIHIYTDVLHGAVTPRRAAAFGPYTT